MDIISYAKAKAIEDALAADSLKITNEIVNGNFAGGTANWTASGGTISAANGVLSLSSTAGYANSAAWQNMGAYTPGKQYCVRVKVRSLAVCSRLTLKAYGTPTAGTVVTIDYKLNPVIGNDYVLRGVMTTPSDGAGNLRLEVQATYTDYSTGGKIVEIRDVFAVPIVGVPQADIERFLESADYFDGQTNITSNVNLYRNSIKLPHEFIRQGMLTVIDRAKALQRADRFSFINIADVHLEPNNLTKQAYIHNMAIAANMLGVGCITINGDVHDGNITTGSTKQRALYELQRMVYNLKSQTNVPVLIGKGNHDDNLWDGEYSQADYGILPSDWHVYCVKPFEFALRFDAANRDGNYFYIDFDDYKIRIIMLNSVDVPYVADGNGKPTYWGMYNHAFQNAQLNWLAATALNFTGKADPNNWGVVVMFHTPIRAEMAEPSATLPINGTIVEGILKAFQTHGTYTGSNTGDFACNVNVNYTGKTGEIICVINGHVHFDRNLALNSIIYIDQLDASTAGAFDIYTIDRAGRKIYTTRYAGLDRTISF